MLHRASVIKRTPSKCHPDVPTYAKGLCRKCYSKKYIQPHGAWRKSVDSADIRAELFLKQHGRCAICNVSQKDVNKPFSLDHNHTTEKVRGLLCVRCNVALGHLKEDPKIIKRVIEYLEIDLTRLL